MKEFLISILLSLFLLVAAEGQTSDFTQSNDSIENYYLLSLEDLVNLEISVASKKDEKISDAPGSITAYSDKDIERFGYYTLRDLADITSGYSSFRGIGEISFETRGQYASGGFDNNKHLVLIDGIPFSHTRANRANAEEDLPLFFAKQVEFLKGPGSSLYGISAFYGVMNILSKSIEEKGTLVESKVSFGSYDAKKRLMTNVVSRSDFGVSKLSIGMFTKNASRDLLGNGTAAQPYNLNSVNYDDQNSTFLNMSHQITTGVLDGAGLGVIYSRKTGGLGDFWMADQNQTYESNQLTWEQMVPYLKFAKSVTKKSEFNSYLKGNISTEHAYVGGWQAITTTGSGSPFSEYKVTVFDYEGLAELTYNHDENTNVIGGVNLVSRHNPGTPESYQYSFDTDPGLFFIPFDGVYNRSSNYNTYSVYTQLQHKVDFLAGLNITAGARLDLGRVIDFETNEITNKYDQVSPRVALVQKLNEEFNLKAMFGSALRAPLIKEIGLNEEFKAENPNAAISVDDVAAETINTWEVSATYNNEFLNMMANFFSNKTTNPIGKVPSGIDGKDINGNINGFISASGYEVDLNVLPINHLRIGVNYSSARAEQFFDVDSTLGDMYNVPTGKLNTHVTYSNNLPIPYSITFVNHNVSSYRSGGITPWGDHQNELMDGFSVVDLNLMTQLNAMLGFELQLRNVFNSEIKTPTFYAANNLSIPFPGRSFMGSINLKF